MIPVYKQQPAGDAYVIMRLRCLGKDLEGEFRDLRVEESEIFHSISEFIYKLELMLEQIDVPPEATGCRKGRGDSADKYGDGRVTPGKPGLFFLIHIRYRCNSSWQGEIRWPKKNCSMTFRSVLELLMVLENTIMQQRNSEISAVKIR